MHLAVLDATEFSLLAEIVQASYREQHLFFKDLDAATESAHDAATVERFEEDLDKHMARDAATGWMMPLLAEFDSATKTQPTPTAVMEAASSLLTTSTLLRVQCCSMYSVLQSEWLGRGGLILPCRWSTTSCVPVAPHPHRRRGYW